MKSNSLTHCQGKEQNIQNMNSTISSGKLSYPKFLTIIWKFKFNTSQKFISNSKSFTYINNNVTFYTSKLFKIQILEVVNKRGGLGQRLKNTIFGSKKRLNWNLSLIVYFHLLMIGLCKR